MVQVQKPVIILPRPLPPGTVAGNNQIVRLRRRRLDQGSVSLTPLFPLTLGDYSTRLSLK